MYVAAFNMCVCVCVRACVRVVVRPSGQKSLSACVIVIGADVSNDSDYLTTELN